MIHDEAKTAFNARAKTSMRDFLRSKTWEEKVEAIERMNVADKLAKAGMRETLETRRQQNAGAAPDDQPL